MLEKYFAPEIAHRLDAFETLQEVRVRRGRQLSVVDKSGIVELDFKVTDAFMEQFFSALCSYSVYALQEEIRNGYITLPQGHRAGLCGRCVTEKGRISTITDISGINIRIAREVKGCAEPIYQKMKRDVGNTVIISPPNCGKTTYLRDLVRFFSKNGKMVSVADERGEISPFCNGESIFDLGKNTDVLRLCPKTTGMMMLLRSMNPEIIVTDEIGTAEDGNAIQEISKSGVYVLTTFHGFCIEDFKERFYGWEAFKYAVVLNKDKKVEEIACLK